MDFTLVEIPDSRSITSEPPGMILRYKAAGEFDEQIAYGYVAEGTPPSIFTAMGQLFKQPFNLDPDGHKHYIATVPYAVKKRDTGQYTFNFDTSGATIKIKAAKEHIGSFPSDGDPDPYKGTIGVKLNQDVEGADIVIPALKLTYSFRHEQGIINESHAKLLAGATGCTNLNLWHSFEPGELLFIGASGSDGSEAEAEVSYNMIASQNATDMTIGAITGIMKGGHHYLWIQFEEHTDADDAAAVKPKRVHVERVYDPIDFEATFGF